MLFCITAIPRRRRKRCRSAKVLTPPEIPAKDLKVENEKVYLVNEDDRPLPSNHWWTQLLVSRFGGSLWSYPFRVDPSETGVDVVFPTRWASAGNDPECELPAIA